MFFSGIKFGILALVLALDGAAAVDEYGIRCNPGGGALPKDGVICFAFRSGTEASDFGDYMGTGHPEFGYVAANGRDMAVDCPNKDPTTTTKDDVVIFRKVAPGQLESWLILKGQLQSGKHKCCAAMWADGDGKIYKWCPDMPPLQI